MKWLQTVPVAQTDTQTRNSDKYNFFKRERIRIRSLIKTEVGVKKGRDFKNF